MSSFLCPVCASDNVTVKDSRGNGQGIRRRRECLSCHSRWTTFEITGSPHKIMRAVQNTIAILATLQNDLSKIREEFKTADFEK